MRNALLVLFIAGLAGCSGKPETEFEKTLRLAEQGDASAQKNLGYMYSHGEGVPEDDAEAVKWYRKAAEQGDADAQYNVGVMYGRGDGVPQVNAEALTWVRKAADQGILDSQARVGAFYFNGHGVPQNYAEAYMWFSIAAANGDEKAKEMQLKAKAQLTPEQLAEAQKRVTQLSEQINANKQ